MLTRHFILPALLLFLLPLVPVHAQGRGEPGAPAAQQPAAPRDEPGGQPATRNEVATAAEEKISQSSHTIRLDGREIKYSATAGTLPIRLDDGKIAARMFFVAYTRDGEDVKTRPVSFLYNGGPGAATIWLHMGSFAPKHVQLSEDGFQPPPPYRLVDNENSLIDVTDLVFIDAIDTGYSRVTAGTNATQFHGQSGDIRSFGEFINEYLKTYKRWPSPKFLIGESYGTIRSAGLSRELQERQGIELNGIVLISSLLTYQTVSPAPDNDVAYASLIQTYRSATAEPQASRRSVAHIRFWGIHRSPYERQRAFRHGTEVYGPEACPLHGALGAIHRRLQSPREFRQIPQGIAPRQAPDDRPARWPLHGARSGCGRRTAGVRPFKHGAARRLHSALPGLREERAEVGKRSALSNVS
ncbi:MAG: hypothetical protein DMG11_34945 [Acidobacteria bacterium]|nr:MAG: hypothetical protein DMG11_34945 [Acidobacteriota bacterium]